MRYSIQAVTTSSSPYVPFLPRLFMSLLALAFLAAGIGAFLQHVIILRTWPPIEATIVRSEVIEFRGAKQRHMYRGEVELAYTVAGKEYQTPESFNTANSSESSVRRRMETTYAPGTRHRIFYDPANPYSIRWDVGINFTFFLLPLAFTGVGLILIGVCWFLWRLPYPPRLACARCGNHGKIDDRYCPRCGEPLAPVDRCETPTPPLADAEQDTDEDFEIPPPQPPRENASALLLVGAFFAVPGLACIAGAAYLGWTTYAATQTWPIAQATVTRSFIEAHRSTDGTPTYQLAVEFDYPGGKNAEHAAGRSLYSSSSYPWIVHRLERFPVGSRHTVRVNPRDLADLRFDTENQVLTWMGPVGLALFGGIFAGIGLSLLRWGLLVRCKVCHHRMRGGAAFCAGCGVGVAGA